MCLCGGVSPTYTDAYRPRPPNPIALSCKVCRGGTFGSWRRFFNSLSSERNTAALHTDEARFIEFSPSGVRGRVHSRPYYVVVAVAVEIRFLSVDDSSPNGLLKDRAH